MLVSNLLVKAYRFDSPRGDECATLMAASADNNIFMTRHISIVTLSPLYLPVRLSGSFTFRNYVNT